MADAVDPGVAPFAALMQGAARHQAAHAVADQNDAGRQGDAGQQVGMCTTGLRNMQAGVVAQGAGLGVNAGHDLNLENLGKFCTIPGVLEVSIGHALIGEALEMGLSNTVKAYLEILETSA